MKARASHDRVGELMNCELVIALCRKPHLVAMAMGMALLLGCSRSAAEKAFESDARGYFCSECRARFYTEYEVHADVCPKCKSYGIVEVVGFVCAVDEETTLAPRGPGVMVCKKCGKPSSSLKLPEQAELEAWGAVRQTKADVSP